MSDKHYAGVVTVNGSPRQVKVNGSPYGRVSIQVDGAVVYDKKPFLQEKGIDFDLLPGKAAKMKWHQVSLTRRECDITVDNLTTALLERAQDGSLRPAAGAEGRQTFNIRMGGLGTLALAAFFFWLNYTDLQEKGVYYPKKLAVIPIMVAMGCAGLLHPKFNFSPKNRTLLGITIAVAAALMIFGITVFTSWFLATFART